jgi:hypothetical protein
MGQALQRLRPPGESMNNELETIGLGLIWEKLPLGMLCRAGFERGL